MKQSIVAFVICVSGLNLMAQALTGLPEHGLSLMGEASKPIIKNDSNRRVIVYVLRFETQTQDGQVIPHTAIRSSLLALRNGVKEETISVAPHSERSFFVLPNELPSDVSRASIDSAIFEDGQFVGPDKSDGFASIVAGINAQRDLHQSFVADTTSRVDPAIVWARVSAIADGKPTSPAIGSQRTYATKQKIFAQELLRIREKKGESAALEMANKSLNIYPKIWRSK